MATNGKHNHNRTIPDSSSTSFQSNVCQCTMCRKRTAALYPQFLMVAHSQLEPDLKSYSTYTEFESSPGRFRGFCNRCGSSLIWRNGEDKEAEFDLFLGTIDERWLVGEKVQGNEQNQGGRQQRRGGVGKSWLHQMADSGTAKTRSRVLQTC
jgi:hypothetical protein